MSLKEYDRYEDFIKGDITLGDIRYSDFEDTARASMFIRNKWIKIREIIIPEHKISEEFCEKYNKYPRGFWDINVLYHFINKGFEFKYFESNWVDMIMEKNGVEIWFEFGQTGISKLWRYLYSHRFFIIASCDNTLFIVKRGKNFKKVIEYFDDRSRQIAIDSEKNFYNQTT